MLTILGNTSGTCCDRMSRRNFLRIGSLGMGGLTLAQLLRAEAAAGMGRSHKAVIMIFLPGGPPHQEMWDIKTAAPSEIRGELNAINTNVPGIDICELFPRLASIADKLVFIRSVVGADGLHNSFQCMTGRKQGDQPPGGWPGFGTWVSRLTDPVKPGMPTNMSLFHNCITQGWGEPGQPGFLGRAHSPFRLNDSNAGDLVLDEITVDRFRDRRKLLTAMDRLRQEVDSSRVMDGLDAFQQQAIGILTGAKLAEALDLSKEDPQLVERYGKGDPTPLGNAPGRVTEDFLVARRLVEAGARVVTLNFGHWDWHGSSADTVVESRRDFPILDQAASALVEDLHNRGLDQDVTVLMWGEFGRSPKTIAGGGRGHWPPVSCALLAGGSLRAGQVIGATDRQGGEAVERPVTFQEVHATMYHNLGLHPAGGERIFDLRGAPHEIVNKGVEPIGEIV